MQAPAGYDLYTEVRKHDVLLAYPYQSIRPFIKMLLRAAADPDVVSIKMTLYRMASDSQIVNALIAAADGKTYNEKNSSKNSGVYDVTEVKAFAFDTSTRYFNVAAKGYYYVVCEVGNEWGDTAFCTYAINGNNEFNRVKYVRDWGMFLKNNTLSVVFLGIAVLSFIGLIVVICIKPKEAGADGDVTPKSKG